MSDIEVPFRVVPPVAGLAAFVTRLDPARLLPVRPLIAIIAFNLMRRRGHTPQELFGKTEVGFRIRRATFQLGHGLHSTIMRSAGCWRYSSAAEIG